MDFYASEEPTLEREQKLKEIAHEIVTILTPNKKQNEHHWTQTLEDERKLHWCADIPCIWDCKKCLKEVLNSNDNDNDE